MIYYTNSPSRFGGCYATHDPLVSQAPVTPPTDATVTTNTAGGGYKFTPFNPGRLNTEHAMQAALKAALEKVEIPPTPEPAVPEVTFTPAITGEDIAPEILRKIQDYEVIADEFEQATRKRLALLEMQHREEEELLVMLLAQEP